VRVSEATFMHNQYVQDVGQQYIGAALKGGLGFQFNYVSFGQVPRTTIAQPGGTGSRLGVSDTSIGAGYGRQLSPGLSLGAGLKYLQESLGDATARGYAADAGVLYQLPNIHGLAVGVSLMNVGPAIKFARATEKLPSTARLGAAYAWSLPHQAVTLAIDASKSVLDKLRLGVGAETLIYDQFAVRAGFTTRQDAGAGVSVGLGWRSQKFSADYAFVPLGDLGNAHRISLSLRWGQPEKTTVAETSAITLESRLAQAEAAIRKEDYVAAKSFLTVGKRALPAGDHRRVRVQERLGFVLLMQNDFTAALEAYTEGVELAAKDGYTDQSLADAYIGIGQCYAAGKNYADARRSFQKGISLGPSPQALKTAQSQLKAVE
jgi:tetratricopeptide (TPR) repeat protein